MKNIRYQFKTFFFFLLIGISLVSCSKEDDNDELIDNGEDLKGSQATAVIGVDNETIQFSTETENSYAAIITADMEGNEIKQLVIVMMDDNSDVMIVAQATPAPEGAISYDLSQPLTENYLFTTSVAVDGKNSSDTNIYGVGTYQHEEDIVIQSTGSFKITSLSSTNVKGTFEMTLYNTYDPDNVDEAGKLTVTEGKFDLPIVELNEEDYLE